MPQDSLHPFYQEMIASWQRCQDAVDGTDAVKGSQGVAVLPRPSEMTFSTRSTGREYLPQPTGMDNSDYANYKARATWFGGTRRIAQGLVGLIFRRSPTVQGPERSLEQYADAAHDIINAAMHERLVSGQYGILIDIRGDNVPINALEASWRVYSARDIINWQWVQMASGARQLSRVMLRETSTEASDGDPYETERRLRLRELRLDEFGQYSTILWESAVSAGRQQTWIAIETRMPQRMGRPLTEIPFVFFQSSEPPPLLDIADLNYSHYRTSADYEWDLHYTSMQTPVFVGWRNPPDEIALGPSGIVITDVDAKVMMLSPSAQGISAKREKLLDCVSHMAILGSRILEPQRRTVEATETVQIRQAGEQSTLVTYADEVSESLTQALRWHAWLIGEVDTREDGDILIQLNRDYFPSGVTAQELQQLVASWQSGALTEQGLHWNLMQGEVLPPDEHEFEVWQQRRELQSLSGLEAFPLVSDDE